MSDAPKLIGREPTPTIEQARNMGAKGAPATEAERLLFEAWMAGHCWALCAEWDGESYRGSAEHGEYLDPRAMNTRQLWAAWRDRAALLAASPQPALHQLGCDLLKPPVIEHDGEKIAVFRACDCSQPALQEQQERDHIPDATEMIAKPADPLQFLVDQAQELDMGYGKPAEQEKAEPLRAARDAVQRALYAVADGSIERDKWVTASNHLHACAQILRYAEAEQQAPVVNQQLTTQAPAITEQAPAGEVPSEDSAFWQWITKEAEEGRDHYVFSAKAAFNAGRALSTPPAVPQIPEGWMRDIDQVTMLAEHLENMGYVQTASGDVDCADQGSAMAAEVVRKVLLPALSAAPAAPTKEQPK